MIRPAYKIDVIHLSQITVPPIEDPAGGADPWAGLTEFPFVDADGNTFTSIFFIVGAKDQDAVIRISRDGVNWSDDIYIYSDDNPVVRYIKAQKIMARNETAGTDSDLQIEIYG